MSFWMLRGKEAVGPLSPEELVWKTRGDLNVLVCRSGVAAMPLGRWHWKLARLFPELTALQQLLPDGIA